MNHKTHTEISAEGPVPRVPIVRKPDFQFENMPRHWMGGNAWGTHMINSFHLIFPEGERFFIRCVRAFEEEAAREPLLKRQVRAFIAQEVRHGMEHEKFQNTLKAQGYEVERFLNFYHRNAYDRIERIVNRTLGPRFSLATTAALEHYTASLAQVAFETDILDECHPAARDMLLWHASEEIEHKAVAFDVYKAAGGGYFTRIGGMIMATFTLAFFTLVGQWSFLRQDRRKKQLPAGGARQFFTHLRKILPIGWLLFRHLLDYFRPSFHPDDIDNRGLAEDFLRGLDLPSGAGEAA